MWRPGRRIFSIACILILLTAAAHTAGNLSTHTNDAGEDQLINTVKAFHFEMGMGMSPSFYDMFRALTFTMSVTFVALGSIGLLLAGSRSVSSAVIRQLTWLYVVWVGAFAVLGYCYRVPPPLISGVVVELALVLAILLPAKNGDDVSVKV